MKLKSVQIRGFRSIENLKLSFEGSGHNLRKICPTSRNYRPIPGERS